MIYLFGLRHSIQDDWDTAGPTLRGRLERLKTALADTVQSLKIVAIVEETSEEYEAKAGKKSLARLLAEGMVPPLSYQPCEPSTLERNALGIPTAQEIIERCRNDGYTDGSLEQCRDAELLKYFPQRERYWLKRLRRVAVRPVLLVCGPDHIRTFSCRLTESGMPCRVVTFDWWAMDEAVCGRLPLDETPI